MEPSGSTPLLLPACLTDPIVPSEQDESRPPGPRHTLIVMPEQAKSGSVVERVLRISLALTFAYILATFFYGLRAHSLALLSEAGHNISDFAALALSFVAVWLQRRPPSDRRTFGYQRAGVLAGFVNALTLLALSLWLIIEAVRRFAHPASVEPGVMMSVAAAGVVMNGVIAGLLWRFSGDVNIRSVFIHMLGDTVSTAAVILGGFAIRLTGLAWIDPLLSVLIAALILWSSLGVLRETLHILLEGTPRSLDLGEVRSAMSNVDGVIGVHDLHVWSLTSRSHALASHVQVAEMPLADTEGVLQRLNHQLRDHFGIDHTTFQLETTRCSEDEGCCFPPKPEVVDGHSHHHHGPGDHSHAHAH